MTTRSAVIVTIGVIAALMVSVALASLVASDISERAGSIITSVLGSLATVLAGLLLFLRVETVNNKVDDAASHAANAARKAESVETKVDKIQHDVLNGGLRDNVKRAISEDRHALRNREASVQARAQIRARKLARGEPVDETDDAS